MLNEVVIEGYVSGRCANISCTAAQSNGKLHSAITFFNPAVASALGLDPAYSGKLGSAIILCHSLPCSSRKKALASAVPTQSRKSDRRTA